MGYNPYLPRKESTKLDLEEFWRIGTGDPLELEVTPGRFVLGWAYSEPLNGRIPFRASKLAAPELKNVFPDGHVVHVGHQNLRHLDENRQSRYRDYLQAIFEALRPIFDYVCELYQSHAYIGPESTLTGVTWKIVPVYSTSDIGVDPPNYVYLRSDGAWLERTHFNSVLYDETGRGEEAALILGRYPYEKLIRGALGTISKSVQTNPQVLDQLSKAQSTLEHLLFEDPNIILTSQ